MKNHAHQPGSMESAQVIALIQSDGSGQNEEWRKVIRFKKAFEECADKALEKLLVRSQLGRGQSRKEVLEEFNEAAISAFFDTFEVFPGYHLGLNS